MSDTVRRWGYFTVEAVAAVAVVVASAPLYTVLLLYAVDAVVGTLAHQVRVALAAPRHEHAPTEPPAFGATGRPGPFRHLLPKVGTVRFVRWLPPVSPHNLRIAARGCVALVVTAGIPVVAAAFVILPNGGWRVVAEWPGAAVLAGGVVATVVKRAPTIAAATTDPRATAATLIERDWRRPETYRPVAPLVVFFPILLLDTAYTSGEVPVAGLSALGVVIAAVLLLARVIYGLRLSGEETPAVDGSAWSVTAPTGSPTATFRPRRRAVWLLGALDGLFGHVGWSPETVDEYTAPWWVRWGRSLLSRVLLVGTAAVTGLVAVTATRPTPIGIETAVVAVTVSVVVAVGLLCLVGVVQFDLAFGRLEYRLYDGALVAYDTRLDAPQWRASLAAVEAVRVERGPLVGPPGVSVGAVAVPRHEAAATPPYWFHETTLVCLAEPDRVADRLRAAVRRGADPSA